MGPAARVKPFRVSTPSLRACQASPTSWPAVAPRRRRGWPPSPAACRGSRLPWVSPSRGHPWRPPPLEDLRGVPWARGALSSCSPRPHNTEGHWASACSVTCILPGVTEMRTVMDTSIRIGADVCVAHVNNEAATMGAGNASLLANERLVDAVREMRTGRGRSVSRRPEPVVMYKPHAAQEATRPHCASGSRLVDGRPWWQEPPDLLPIAKDDVMDAHRQLVADEAMLFGALTMSRNVLGGSLQRHVSVYDVVAASVQRLGVCVDSSC